MKKVLSLVGARPQFIKEALVGAAAREAGAWEHILVHSGQHYDAALSDVFFEELGIPQPKYHLGIGSGSHAAMTAAALTSMEDVLLQERPDALLVYGDTNTTLAGSLAAAKLHIPVVHVEAGIRMEPKTMPEEINRILTDHVSSVFCCCSQHEMESLRREGIIGNVSVTGDVMYDVFLRMCPRFTPEALCTRYGLIPGGFAVVTLHRDYNVDHKKILEVLLRDLGELAKDLRILFFLHPRTRKRVEEFGLEHLLTPLLCAPPESYISLMSLVQSCDFVITDSGGLQKEAYYAGKRAVVVMPDTGWRALVECGWNVLAGGEQGDLKQAAKKLEFCMAIPKDIYGSGEASWYIVNAITRFLN